MSESRELLAHAEVFENESPSRDYHGVYRPDENLQKE